MKQNFNYRYWVPFLGLMSLSVHAESGKPSFARQTLLSKAVTLPSNKLDTKVVRVKFSPGYKTPVHTHDGPGPRYVLNGKLRVEDGGETHDYTAGDVFWETGSEMTVENVGSGEAEIVIFEMAPSK